MRIGIMAAGLVATTIGAMVLGQGLTLAGEQTEADAQEKPTPAALNFTMKRITGEPVHLGDYAGQVVLIVNVASRCGLTPQYEGLQNLHEKYAEQGLAILGFPANEFRNQEPGSDEEIAAFCKENYGVEFDLFSKIVVKGEDICDLYRHLTSEETNPRFAGEITWNFEKFLLDREGNIIARFGPRIRPEAEEVIAAIEAALAR